MILLISCNHETVWLQVLFKLILYHTPLKAHVYTSQCTMHLMNIHGYSNADKIYNLSAYL